MNGHLLDISRQGFDEDVNVPPVSVDAWRYCEDDEYRRLRECTEHGGHRGGQCHESDECCQNRVHAGEKPSRAHRG